MVVIILLVIVAFVVIKFVLDYHNRKVENIAIGGIKKKMPEWVKYYINSGFSIIEETGSKIIFYKPITGEMTGKPYKLYIVLESVFTNILSGYVITKTGTKIKSDNVEFKGSDNIQNIEKIEQITRRVLASLESKGIM